MLFLGLESLVQVDSACRLRRFDFADNRVHRKPYGMPSTLPWSSSEFDSSEHSDHVYWLLNQEANTDSQWILRN